MAFEGGFGGTLGPLLDHFWVTLGSLLGYFGITLGSLWGHFGVILGSLWGHFGVTLGSPSGHFGATLGSFWNHFGTSFGQKVNNYIFYRGTIKKTIIGPEFTNCPESPVFPIRNWGGGELFYCFWGLSRAPENSEPAGT